MNQKDLDIAAAKFGLVFDRLEEVREDGIKGVKGTRHGRTKYVVLRHVDIIHKCPAIPRLDAEVCVRMLDEALKSVGA